MCVCVCRSLLGEFGRLFLGFQSVYERLDAALHAGGHPARHRVRGGRRGGAGALGGRPGHQTLLIPQLRERERGFVTWVSGVKRMTTLQRFVTLLGCGSGF